MEPGTSLAGQPQDRLAGRLLTLALVLAVARLLGAPPSLWFDEALTAADALAPREGLNHNPLFYWLTGLATRPFGGIVSEASLRVLAMGASILQPLATYWALRPLVGRRAAAWGALLIVASPWTLHWALNARAYGPGLLLVTLGLGSAARARADARWWPWAVLTFGAALSLHLSFALLPLALLVAAPLSSRRRPSGITWLLAGLLVAAGAPWAWRTLSAYFAQKGEIRGLQGVQHFLLAAGFALTPPLGLAALFGARRGEDASRAHRRWLALAAGGGAVAVAGLAWLGQTTAQYVFCLLPACVGLAGSLVSRPGRIHRLLGPALALGLLTQSALEAGIGGHGRSRWREAISIVQSLRGPDDEVLVAQAGLAELYAVPGFADARAPRSFTPLDRTQPEQLFVAARGGRVVWVILRPDFLQKWPADVAGRLMGLLKSHGEPVRRLEVPAVGRDLALEVYRVTFSGPRP